MANGSIRERNTFGQFRKIHGLAGTSINDCYHSMKSRCYNKNDKDYALYGGRGIKVCKRWRDSFEAFFEDMGPKPSPKYSLDRYPNKDGDYEPGNCRWATWREQQNNRRNNRRLTLNGKTHTITQWERITGISNHTIRARIRMGWSVEKALTTPIGMYSRWNQPD